MDQDLVRIPLARPNFSSPNRLRRYSDAVERPWLEIESLAEFDAHITRARRLAGWLIKSVNLTHRTTALRRVDPAGAIFLECTLTDMTYVDLARRGAHVVPSLNAPFDPYRFQAYSATELFDRTPVARCLDTTIQNWQKARATPAPLATTLAMALHDRTLTDALEAMHLVADRGVGIMGGPGMRRDQPEFLEIARLGALMTEQGAVVLTGGGPGAMEAANLGVRFAHRREELPTACAQLAGVPSFHPDIDAWVSSALEVCARWAADEDVTSLGVPAWGSGLEPTHACATHIAKFFCAAHREAAVLHRCRGGLVFFPGAAGTVQQILRATTSDPDSAGEDPVPLILVDRAYWTTTLPVWPLLAALVREGRMQAPIHLVDQPAEVLGLLRHSG